MKKRIEHCGSKALSISLPMTHDCVSDIRVIITRARQSVVRHVNSTMVLAYWLVGRRLVVEEQKGAARATYGEHLIERVSKEISEVFGNGFGIANLRNFRQFYLQNPAEKQIRYALRSELSWTHFRALIRVGDPKERAYYLEEAEIDYPEVRFSVLSECNQLFATKLMPYMPTKAELQFEIEQARSRTGLRRRSGTPARLSK